MLLFFIKKAFFDAWDNILTLALINLGFIIVLFPVFYIPWILSEIPILSVIVLCLGILLFSLYAGAASRLTGALADYKSVTFRDFLDALRDSLADSLLLGIITIIQVITVVLIIPFYFQVGGILGLASVSTLFWVSVCWLLAGQYYLPVAQRLRQTAFGTVKKSLLLLMDNLSFSIFMGLGSLFLLLVSGITVLLVPGISAILLWHQVGTRLRLYKYDYLENHPEAKRNEIPWETLLSDERRNTGPRSVKGMIFPWKE